METKVFISYAREDKVFAEKLYKDLHQEGVKAWLDSVDLMPGQNWEATISVAIQDCRYFIALLSSRSVGKKGYVQKEIRDALKIAQEYPPDKIYKIPLRIDICEPAFPDLKRLHIANFFPDYDQCFKDILRVFKYDEVEKPVLNKVDDGIRLGNISRLTDKGFGFVVNDNGVYFFHAKELVNVEFHELHAGDIVKFKLAKGPKGIIATNVKRG